MPDLIHYSRRMTPEDIRRARRQLGLSQSQLAQVLDTDQQTIRRIEAAPEYSTHRPPAVRMVRLIHAYLDGYRPPDWPERGRYERPGPAPKD